MQNKHGRLYRRLYGAAALALGGLVSMAAAPLDALNAIKTSHSTRRTRVAHRAYTDLELFRGVVFGEGDVAAALPEIWTPEARARVGQGAGPSPVVQRAKALILEGIARKDPTFVHRFADAARSGDHVRIAQALDEYGPLVQSIARPSGQTSTSGPAPADPLGGQGDCDISVAAAFSWLIVVMVQAAITINYTITYNLTYTTGAALAESAPPLQRDRAVELIATRLAAA